MSSFGAEAFGGCCQSVLASLPGEAEIDILVSPDAASEVQDWVRETGRPGPTRIVNAPPELDFSLWVQDVFAIRAGIPRLVMPAEFDRYHDLKAAAFLADAAGLATERLDYAFEGGNVLACDDWLLIGGDGVGPDGADAHALAAALDPHRTPVVLECAEALPAEQTRPIPGQGAGWTETLYHCEFLGRRQPLFHIDLFVAPAGRTGAGQPQFLVGCPRMGAEMLGHALPEHALAPAFDEIAAQLEAAGAAVLRNPMPLIWVDDVDKRHRTWFHLPVNNVLVEDCGPAGRHVLLPCFAQDDWSELDLIDAANRALWERLGFTVQPIPDLLPLAENRGALHCMCKVIERRPA
ncbi:MAG: hypothetical protein AAFV19_12215 [Pseudomonadota bacterium]